MASGIETRTQLYEILDKIQDNLNSNDTYSNMKLYFNEMMKTAVIYQIVGEEGLSNDINIVAIFNPERILLSELEYFKGAILKNVNVINVDSIGINEVGLGGFIDFDRLINNICVALGVKLGKNFAKNNPLIYSELRNICIKYTSSLNNSPYFMQEAGTSYYSLVPYNIVLDVAIYLNSIGLFNVGTVNPTYFDSILESSLSKQLIEDEELLDYCDSFRDIYDVKSKSEYINGAEDFINYRYGTYTLKEQYISTANAFFTEYEDEIDFNNNLYLTIGSEYTNVNNYKVIITLREFTASTLYRYGNPTSTVNNSSASSAWFYLYNNSEDITFTQYTFTKTVSNGAETYSYNKTTSVYPQSNNVVTLQNIQSYGYSNINFNRYNNSYIKPIGSSGVTSYNIIEDYYLPLLSNNVRYDNIKFRKTIGYNILDAINNKKNLWTKSDLVIYASQYIYIFKNVTSILSDVMQNFGSVYGSNFKCIARGYKTTSGTEYTASPFIRLGTVNSYDINLKNHFIDFGTSVDYEVYYTTNPNNNWSVTLTDSGNVIRYTFADNRYISRANVGAIVKIEPPEVLQDITLESGATYPQTVIDSSTFISTYPNWYRQDSYQPEIDEDGQVLNSRTATTWINLDVDSPSNQSEAQEGNLDNADLDSLIRDIDKAEEDDDTNDPSSDDDAEDEGEVEETDPEDVPSTLILIQQAVFPNTTEDAQNLYNFVTGLFTNSFFDIIKDMALGNPINGIVSCVATYDGLWNETDVTTKDVVIWGQKLTYDNNIPTPSVVQAKHIAHQIKEIDLGTIDLREDLPPEYTEDNYTDITDRELGLYLPFVGMVSLDIRDFIGKQLQLKARVDSVTGTIIYNVYDIGDNFKHLNKTFSGNCQSQTPLKSEDFSQLMRNIASTAGTVGALTLL